MDELVTRLGREQEVSLGGRDPAATRLLDRVAAGQPVFVRFPRTRGGTELLVAVAECVVDEPGDRVRLTGHVRLNGVPARCVADLSLTDLRGTGRLVASESG